MNYLSGPMVLEKHLANAFHGATDICIAVGYISPAGLWSVVQRLERSIHKDARIRLAVGTLLEGPNRPDDTRALRNWLASNANRVDLRQVRSSTGIFHPKLYLARTAKGWRGVLGSSNLTRRAFQDNIELDVVLDGDAVEFAKLFEVWWELGTPVSTNQWPQPPGATALVRSLVGSGVLAGFDVYVGHHEVRVSQEWKKATKSLFEGRYVRLRGREDLVIEIVSSESLAELRGVVRSARADLRRHSIRTPWGHRFVPPAMTTKVDALHRRTETSFDAAVRAAVESVPSQRSLQASVAAEVKEICRRRKITREARKDLLSRCDKRAVAMRTRFVEQCPRPVQASMGFWAPPVFPTTTSESPSAVATGFAARTRDGEEQAWKTFLITLCSAPRRSLKKYRNIEHARGLLLFNDKSFEQTLKTTRDLVGSTTEILEQELEEQIERIESWRSERYSLADVLARLEELIG